MHSRRLGCDETEGYVTGETAMRLLWQIDEDLGAKSQTRRDTLIQLACGKNGHLH